MQGNGKQRLREPADLSWHAEDLARQVFDRLYPTPDDVVREGRRAVPPQCADEFTRRELGMIVSMFGRVLPGMGQVDALHLHQWAMSTADKSHRKKCRTTRGAWWGFRFNHHTTAKARSLSGQSPHADMVEHLGPPQGGPA